ncbi:E3 ubiquitin-protein ligase RLIM-like [Trifolium pratense]|uniref:E3 ubiquitin-protein ligase RLIM-like n=1 Tax=Trifolium pratense TaxID=57577 RepID=UPI001E694821|nr:E3 ubiquitin-protein ligase RLIM-like [Trifolium pratense]XP_045798663.1 E3 ubiquitin-protein ligase RLIM-like [Trifolium pratense]
MAANSDNILSLSLRPTSEVDGGNDSRRVAVCSLCRKALSPDDEITGDLSTGGVCGDCKFLLLEDFGNHTLTQSSRRRLRGRLRHGSSESVENPTSVDEDQFVDGDNPAWSLQYASANTTPSGSRSWRHALSDTDSDGFDNWHSLHGENEFGNWSPLYGENESSSSFIPYRIPRSETDSFSFSAYGGESDISVDRQSFVGTGIFNLPDEGDEFDSDTDIDPMHAGIGHWNSDDTQDNDEEEEDEDDEDEGERELPEVEAATEPEGIFSQIIRETWLALDDADLPHGSDFGDFLDTRRFDDLLDHLAQNDSSRRGAPPAAASFVNNLPCVVISKEHEKHDELVCAICKDVLALGTKVNQLPCSHLYHSHCILPWLKTRNSCPLCRFELPTDDKDYEEGKQTTDGRNVIYERHQLNVMDDSFSDISDGAEAGEEDGITTHDTADSSAIRGGRGRWLFLAAAPIVSLVGMVIVLWLGRNSQIEGTRHSSAHYLSAQNQHGVRVYGSQNQRESRSRRWWCPF